MGEEKKEIRLGLWTYTALIVVILILTSAIIFGWYYIFAVKKADNSNPTIPNVQGDSNYQNNIGNYTIPGYENYVYNTYTGYYDFNGSQYIYNEFNNTMEMLITDDYGNYMDHTATTIITEKISPQLSASTILKTLYENAYFVYTSQAGFEYDNDGNIVNYDEIINKHFNLDTRQQYENWERQNGRYLSSQLINITFKDIKTEENKISATVVGDLLYQEYNVIKKGLENKFEIEHNGTNWVVTKFEIPDTYISNYVQHSGEYRITKLSEITDKFSVEGLVPDYLYTQHYQEDRYQKIDYDDISYENNSIRIIDLYHKNNYNKLMLGSMYIEVADDMKSAKVSDNGSEAINIENINGTIKKIFVGNIYLECRPVMLMEDGTVKIAKYSYGKYYAETINGLNNIQDLRNATISSFVQNSNGDYELAAEQQQIMPDVAEPNCIVAIDASGNAYKIEFGGGGY